MDNLKNQAAHLRRTYRYPTGDSDSDSQPEAIDEQEQESFIQNLAAENSARNATFNNILIALPIAAVLPYLPALLNQRVAMLSLLSITSLLSTAFLLYSLPPTATGIAILDQGLKYKKIERQRGLGKAGRRAEEQKRLSGLGYAQTPLELHLPYLNLALVVILMVTGSFMKSDAPSFGIIGMGYLPAVIYGVVLLAKMIMASVDPESELSGLRYQYKGA